jgi:hypothetical protein
VNGGQSFVEAGAKACRIRIADLELIAASE